MPAQESIHLDEKMQNFDNANGKTLKAFLPPKEVEDSLESERN